MQPRQYPSLMPAVAIKISEEVAELVRRAAAASNRSMAGQVEHWARLAMEIEDRATVTEVNAIKAMRGDADSIDDVALRERVVQLIEDFRSTPPEELRERIGLDRKAVFEPDPDTAGAVVRIDPDGTRTHGRLVGRRFVPSE